MESTDATATQSEVATALPSDKPRATALAELFRKASAVETCRFLVETHHKAARHELQCAFEDVDGAPDAFLLAMAHWPSTSSAATREKFLRLVNEAVRGIENHPAPQISTTTSERAGALLLTTFPECRNMFISAFVRAFRIGSEYVQQYAAGLVVRNASQAVKLLESLKLLHLLGFELVVQASMAQEDVYAGDIYVKHYPEHQRTWITALLRGRTADKLIKKRIALFKLDEAEFPDYVERKAKSALRFCVHNESYEDALTRTQDDAALRLYVTRFLVERKGPFDPITRLFVHRADLASQFPHVDTSQQDGKTFPDKDDLAPLNASLSVSALIGDENIVFVDSQEGLDACVSDLAQADVVGFDCEWKSSTASENVPCAVLQLASSSRAYVVDMVALSGDAAAPLVDVFESATVMKLGFHTKGDLSVLRAVMPKTRTGSPLVVRCLVDMQALTKKIDNHNARLLEATQQLESTNNAEDTKEDGEVVGNEAKEGEQEETVVVVESARKKQKSWRKDRKQQRPTDASQTVSLATLAEQYLGKPLDKRSRLSDWERRPLTRAQLHYAALDAYALVAIYKKMQEQVSSEVFERFIRQLTKKEQGRQRAADAAASAIITSETMR
ncbi:hypothetical protein Poli38472_000426 [Pythium oligandrum]|uniref:3'-5' exonuclease domain-containing protein n=1 Tax=Pythium oligandrum TaxID=41045 RepID=A0A8K1CBM0_PYTOL|nr:hypothetical protein Poli38472_000426 [Pythium oligandrum]|eukprot:TMW60384.1 hypothetical protein Poli38472_000426 [Pythium oligandrum]